MKRTTTTEAAGLITLRSQRNRVTIDTNSRFITESFLNGILAFNNEKSNERLNPAIPENIYARAIIFSSKNDRNIEWAVISNKPEKIPISIACTGSK
jgi:hypothetical protein